MLSGFREKVRLAKLLLPEAGTGINSIPGSCSGFDEEDGFWVRKQLENHSSASPSSLCPQLYTQLYCFAFFSPLRFIILQESLAL